CANSGGLDRRPPATAMPAAKPGQGVAQGRCRWHRHRRPLRARIRDTPLQFCDASCRGRTDAVSMVYLTYTDGERKSFLAARSAGRNDQRMKEVAVMLDQLP